ncbi:MAG TPA: TolC family protein [Candidatus Polarisedimenticolia bacterium]|jgi:outer membrane protein|nr:TolC family protein [Candidatus Polarisedimenticolia bacterium]
MRRTRSAAAVIAALFLAARQGLLAAPGPLTLPDAVRVAFERDPALAAARAEADAWSADLDAARAARWPRLLTAAEWHRTDGQVAVFGDKLMAGEFTADDFALDALNDPEALNHASLGVLVQAPLYTAGRIRHAIDAADESSLASRAHLRAAAIDLVEEVTRAYDGALLAQATVGIARDALVNARGHERAAAARYEEGSALKSDPLRAEVHRLARERDLERADAGLEIVRSRLRVLLGLAPGDAILLADAEPLAPAEPLTGLQEWLDASAAAGGRPEIEAARRAGAAAEAQDRAAAAARGPEVDGIARYDVHANGLDGGEGSYFAGLQIRWAAFDRVRSSRIDAARARAQAAEAWSRVAEDRARLDVEQAWRDADVADRNAAIARQGLAAAEEARRIAAERYAGGLLPLTDLLDAETALLETRLAEIGARFDAAVSRVRLSRASGRLEVPR